jgi:hypothetical protein
MISCGQYETFDSFVDPWEIRAWRDKVPNISFQRMKSNLSKAHASSTQNYEKI